MELSVKKSQLLNSGTQIFFLSMDYITFQRAYEIVNRIERIENVPPTHSYVFMFSFTYIYTPWHSPPMKHKKTGQYFPMNATGHVRRKIYIYNSTV